MTLSYPDISKFPIADSLRLIRTTNIGPVTFFELVAKFKTPAKALEAIPELAIKGGRRDFKLPDIASVEKEIEDIQKINARIIPYGDGSYSKLLAAIYDPPPLLFAKGNPELLNKNILAIVGSRNASTNGRLFARKIADELSKAGLVIASGLARGIDTEAHNASLAEGTIGVIAGGVDNIYPPENKDLYAKMVGQGLIISEQQFGSQPTATAFPRRNRIISGISKAVLVVEASLKSGSLITAHMAAEQGRDIFAVPGSPMDSRSRGCNRLIKEGAGLVESAEEILTSLQLNNKSSLFSGAHQIDFGLNETANHECDLETARREIMEHLGPSPTNLDELALMSHIPVGIVRTALLELELAGKVERVPGNRFALLCSA